MKRSLSLPSSVPRLLERVEYPTDKAELLNHAAVLDAPSALREAVARLPSHVFSSQRELAIAIERLV